MLNQAQPVLMRKLGIIKEKEDILQEAREAYARLFEHPLSCSHLTALAALFGWTVQSDTEAHSTDFLLV